MSKGEFSRNSILSSAKGLIAEKGFIAVTLEEILEAAQVTKGKFFHYFESKEDFFRELLSFSLNEREFPNFEDLLQSSVESNPLSKILFLLDRAIDWHKAGLPEQMRLCVSAAAIFPRKTPEIQKIVELLSRNVSAFERLFKDAIAQKLLPDSIDPRVMSLLFSSSAMGGNTIGFLVGEENLSVKNLIELRKMLVVASDLMNKKKSEREAL